MPLYAITVKSEAPERVSDLIKADKPPELHGDFGVYDVTNVAGIAHNWIRATTGAFVAPPAPGLTDAVRSALKDGIDRAAEMARTKYVTPGSGQAAVYLSKQAEANAVEGDANPSADKYPLLAASVGVEADPTTGKPCADVAAVGALVRKTAAAWSLIAADIEGRRMRAKKAVDAAASFADALTAANVEWPSGSDA